MKMISAWGYDQRFSLRAGDVQVDFFSDDYRPHECIPGYQAVSVGNTTQTEEILRVADEFGIPVFFGDYKTAIEYAEVP